MAFQMKTTLMLWETSRNTFQGIVRKFNCELHVLSGLITIILMASYFKKDLNGTIGSSLW